MALMKLSAVVLAKNAQGTLAHCLKSLSFCSEVIVVDDNSTDNTVVIAKKLGAKVFYRDLDDDFSAQRNFGLKKVRNEWVLFIDADERVSKDLKKEISKALSDVNFNGYFLRRYEVWLGKKLKYGEWGEVELLRLAKSGAGKWKRKVHETWEIDGRTGVLNNYLEHRVDASVGERLGKINFYCRLHAVELAKEGKSVGFWRVLLMPAAKFGMNYFVKRGYRDGGHGFVMAAVMSLHSFLAWSDIWLLGKK